MHRVLAPNGKLRVGINLANKLLVKSDEDRSQETLISGIAPEMGRRLAEEIGAECVLVPFDSPGEAKLNSDYPIVRISGVEG